MGNSLTIKLSGLEELNSKLDTYKDAVKRNIALATTDAALNIAAEAKQNLSNNKSVITGSLVKSFRIQKITPTHIEVGSNIEYAPDVEYGTAAHEITPKTAKCLAFEVDGKTVFVKRVHHPGTKGKPYLNPAVEKTRPIYQQQLKEALKGD